MTAGPVCRDCGAWPCDCAPVLEDVATRPLLATLLLVGGTLALGGVIYGCSGHRPVEPAPPACTQAVVRVAFDGAEDRADYLVTVSCPMSWDEIPMDDHDARR